MNRMLGVLLGVVAVLIVAAGVVGIVLVAGSGGDDDDDGDIPSAEDSPSEDGDGDDDDDAEENPTRDPASAGAGGSELRLIGSDPTDLDPAQVRDAASAEYVVEIFGGLLTLDQDLELVGDIAESWEVSDDGLVYTFTLRDDVVFHFGRRVTAEDFKYSWERAADPETLSPTVLDYMGEIVGLEEKVRGEAEEIEGVQVIDEQTLQVTIKQPIPFFLYAMTYPVSFVVDQEQIEDNPRNWTRLPNGTGPYRLIEFELAQRIVLEANDRYHLGAPSVQTVVFELAGGSQLTRYENGELDIAGANLFDLEALRDPSNPLNAELQEATEYSTSYIGFNIDKEPFDDPLVRQAFAMAIDRQRIVEVVLLDAYEVADGFMPPGMPGYDEAIEALPFDPEGAQQLLEESSYGGADGLPDLTLTIVGQGGEPADTIAAIVGQWEENLGVSVELQQVEYATYLRELRNDTFQFFSAGWIADYPDPENFLDKLFHSESQQNELGYHNEEVDELLNQARTEQDQELRFSLYQEVERQIIDEAVVIPLWWPKSIILVKPYVQNYLQTPIIIPKLRYVTLSEE